MTINFIKIFSSFEKLKQFNNNSNKMLRDSDYWIFWKKKKSSLFRVVQQRFNTVVQSAPNSKIHEKSCSMFIKVNPIPSEMDLLFATKHIQRISTKNKTKKKQIIDYVHLYFIHFFFHFISLVIEIHIVRRTVNIDGIPTT